MQKFKVNGRSVPKTEWKQMNSWTDAIAVPPSLMRSVKMGSATEQSIFQVCDAYLIERCLLPIYVLYSDFEQVFDIILLH